MRPERSQFQRVTDRIEAAEKSQRRHRRGPRRAARAGFSLLEFEVAFVVFGIALTGLFPLVIMQSRAIKALERRDPLVGQWYLAPSSDPWGRKLGASAVLTSTAPDSKPTPPVLLGDDGDTGYAVLDANWTPVSDPQAFQADYSSHPQMPEGSPDTEVVAWTFTNIVPGWYQVQVTWLEASEHTDGARYVLSDGETSLGTVAVSQQLAPVGPSYGGRPWQIVATQYIRNGTVRVALIGPTLGDVVADGLQLVPIENNVQILSLDKSLTNEQVTTHVSVEQLVPH